MRCVDSHEGAARASSASRTARTNARILSGSFIPLVSTPLRTSTAYGRTRAHAVADVLRRQAAAHDEAAVAGESGARSPTANVRPGSAAARRRRARVSNSQRRVLERARERARTPSRESVALGIARGYALRYGPPANASQTSAGSSPWNCGIAPTLSASSTSDDGRIDEHRDERDERRDALGDVAEALDAPPDVRTVPPRSRPTASAPASTA